MSVEKVDKPMEITAICFGPDRRGPIEDIVDGGLKMGFGEGDRKESPNGLAKCLVVKGKLWHFWRIAKW